MLRVMVMLLALTGALSAAESPEVTFDGLERVTHKKLGVVYRKPGAQFSSFTRIMLDPVEVAFKKSWKPDPRQVSANDRERIRKELAEEFRRVFEKELQEMGGYTFVDAPAPDVLRVTAAIIDLYISAPDTMSAGRSRTYVVSAGEMTLVAELRDAESGEILARVADRRRGRETGMMQWASRSTNVSEARAALTIWAKALRDGLDAARSASPPSA